MPDDLVGILAIARMLKRDPRQIRRAVRGRSIPKPPWAREIVPGIESLLQEYTEQARERSNGNLRGEAIRRRRLERAGTAVAESVDTGVQTVVPAEPFNADAVPHRALRFALSRRRGVPPVAN